MKKKCLILGMCALFMCGCGKTIPTLSDGSEAVVTLSNGDMISVNDLYNDLKDSYALDSLINLIDKKILEDKYADLVSDASDYAESTISSYEEYYGGEDELLSIIQSNTTYSTIEAFQNYIYLSYLRNEAIEDYAKDQITDKEVEEYYNKNIYGDVLVNHILITSKATDDSTDEEKETLDNEAIETVNTIIAKLKESDDVKTTFTELAAEYSEDESTKDNGGSLGYINNGTLSSSYDEILETALSLSDGEFSTEVITTELGYHVIYREASKEKASIEDVTDSIKETLAEELLNDDATVQIEALQQLRKDYGVDIVDSEIQSQYASYIQNALASAQSSD